MIKLKDLIRENGDYKGEHTAPDPQSSAPLYDLTLNDIYPKDVYQTLHHYKTGEVYDNDSLSVIDYCREKPRSLVTIYRAVPKDVKQINEGDWVTLSRRYAKDHGESNLEKGNWKILKKTVRAKDLWNDGDSIHEWGYVINPDPKIGNRKFYSKEEMIRMGADGYLSKAVLKKIRISKIDGREPIPEPNSYKKGKPITQPIEVEYQYKTGKYILYSGNHRVKQAEINGDEYIPSFVQYNYDKT